MANKSTIYWILLTSALAIVCEVWYDKRSDDSIFRKGLQLTTLFYGAFVLPTSITSLTDWYVFWKVPLQFLAVFLLVSWVYFKIHGTYVAQLLKGVAFVLAFYLITNLLNLTIISGILQAILQISIIGFIILFQPELRRLLVYLGQPELFGKATVIPGSTEGDRGADYMVRTLLESARLLSKTKTGALIVLESQMGSTMSYLEAGTKLDANLSIELLLTLFHPNTPLHDGAVVISPSGRVVAAGVLLPLSENPNLSWKYGTRHRAAIGLTEVSDSRCLIVSEETGTISIASGGHLEKIASLDALEISLNQIYGIQNSEQSEGKKGGFGDLLSSEIFQRFFSRKLAGKSTSSRSDSH